MVNTAILFRNRHEDKLVVFPNIMFMFHSIFPLTFKKLYKMQLIALITSIYQLSYWNRASIYVHSIPTWVDQLDPVTAIRTISFCKCNYTNYNNYISWYYLGTLSKRMHYCVSVRNNYAT